MPSHMIINVQSVATGVSMQVKIDWHQFDNCRHKVEISATTAS